MTKLVVGPLTWAWVIIIGGFMITPGGIFCIVCGPILTKIIGIISIALGVMGIISFFKKGNNSSQL
jgi:hypothetical protein